MKTQILVDMIEVRIEKRHIRTYSIARASIAIGVGFSYCCLQDRLLLFKQSHSPLLKHSPERNTTGDSNYEIKKELTSRSATRLTGKKSSALRPTSLYMVSSVPTYFFYFRARQI